MKDDIRFSEAMLLGSTMLRAARGFIYSREPMVYLQRGFPFIRITMEERGCALGMAEAAAGIRHGAWAKEWPFLLQVADCPCPCFKGTRYERWRLDGIVAHLFNKHVMRDKTWTLQSLADWVSHFEPVETDERQTAEKPGAPPFAQIHPARYTDT